MNLPKAIEILTKWRNEESYDDEEELHQAEALSIEALKRLSKARQQYSGWSARPLPGETKD